MVVSVMPDPAQMVGMELIVVAKQAFTEMVVLVEKAGQFGTNCV